MCAPLIHLNAVLKIARNLPFHLNVCFAKEIKTPRTEIAIIMYVNSFSLILRFRLTPWQQFCRENKNLRVIPQEARIWWANTRIWSLPLKLRNSFIWLMGWCCQEIHICNQIFVFRGLSLLIFKVYQFTFSICAFWLFELIM